MRLSEIVGNAEAGRQALAYLDAGRLPHALLIEGQPGSGRKTMASALAKAAVCLGEEKPCDQCRGCKKAAAGVHPDIQLVADGKVDTIREVLAGAYVMPNEAPVRVIIIPEVQTLTVSAQNALLKTLEEPPAHLMFLLTCENRAQILPTILSRVVCMTMEPVDEDEGVAWLCRQDASVSEAEWRRALRAYGGLLGAALAGVHDGDFRRVGEIATAIASAITAPDELPLLKATALLEKEKKDKSVASGVLRSLTLITRDAVCQKLGGGAPISADSASAQSLASGLTAAQLAKLIEVFDGLQASLEQNINYTLFLTLLCARVRAAVGR